MKRNCYSFFALVLLVLACAKSEPIEPQEQMGTPVEEPVYISPSEPFEVETVPMVFDGQLEPDPTEEQVPDQTGNDGQATDNEGQGADNEGEATGNEGQNEGEEETKAYVNGSVIYWQNSDLVAVYDNLRPTKHSYTVTRNSSNPRYATLSGSVTAGSTSWYAVYPQAAIARLSDGVCEVTLPHVQHAGSRYVDPSALISIANDSNSSTSLHGNLSFHNVYALLSFKVSQSNITHIQLIGNQGSVLAGTVTVNAATGKITAIKDPKTEIHLYPNSTYFETNKEYYIPILPYDSTVSGSTYLNGFTLIMYTSSETTESTTCYVKRTDKTLSLARGQGQRLGNITSGTGYSSETLAPAANSGYYNTMLDFRFPGGTAHAYRVALYRDAACTDLVVAHNIPASALNSSSGVFKNNNSYFTFGSLESGTTYYFRGIDRTTGRPTCIVPSTQPTISFTPLTMQSSALVGEDILREDFSELCYGSTADLTAKGGPHRVSSVTTTISSFTPFTGEIREGSGVYYMSAGNESRLFAFGRNALGATRLADWAEYAENTGASCNSYNTPVCGRCGLLKLGASNWTGGIVTPPITCIPAGKKATINVTVVVRAYSDTEKDMAVDCVDGKVGTLSGTDPYIDTRHFTLNRTYDTQLISNIKNDNYYTKTVNITAYPGSRILIRADRSVSGSTAGSAQQRAYLRSVKLNLVSLSDDTSYGSLSFSNVGLQGATVSFPTTNSHVYQTYLQYVNTSGSLVEGTTEPDGGSTIATVTGNGSTKSVSLNKLSFGTTYRVRIHDNTNNTDVGTGYVRTARIWQNKNSTGQRFVSIGWDQLFRTELGGSKQAYIVEFWTGGNKVVELNPIQPGEESSEATIFGNCSILGRGYDKNGTQLDQGDWQGGTLKCENWLTPTGISVGGLVPNTTYNVRVRPVSSVTYTIYKADGTTATQDVTHTLSHAFKGTSPNTFPVKTDAARTAASNELLWCGFEDFCVQQDYSNRTVGSVPYAASHSMDKTAMPLTLTDLTTLFGSTLNPYCFYAHNQSGHQLDTWRLGVSSTNIDGTSGAIRGYRKGETPASGLNNVVVGDFGNWYCNTTSKPRMGQLMLLASGEDSYVNSPKLTDSYLGAKKTFFHGNGLYPELFRRGSRPQTNRSIGDFESPGLAQRPECLGRHHHDFIFQTSALGRGGCQRYLLLSKRLFQASLEVFQRGCDPLSRRCHPLAAQ